MRKFISLVIGVTITLFLLSIVSWAKFDSNISKEEVELSDSISDSLKSKGNINYIREENSDRLAYWFPYHDSLDQSSWKK